MLFGISQFRAAYRAGELSPVEAIESQLAYADVVASEVNAISQVSPTALDEARESEARRAAGRPKGPLDGMPVVVKDSHHIAGMNRWHGSAIHDGDAPSGRTSEPIERLREAGAIVVAKTTMPDMGMLGAGISSQFGIVRNPWNKDINPGGSGAGAGASLACGLSAFGLGTDIAGSVRLPAVHCELAADAPGPGDEDMLLHHAHCTAWFNQTGQPAAVYREKNDAETELPIGVQVVGRRFDDAGTLAVAAYLESTREEVAPFPAFEESPEYD